MISVTYQGESIKIVSQTEASWRDNSKSKSILLNIEGTIKSGGMLATIQLWIFYLPAS
jgi:hypothetical protein